MLIVWVYGSLDWYKDYRKLPPVTGTFMKINGAAETVAATDMPDHCGT